MPPRRSATPLGLRAKLVVSYVVLGLATTLLGLVATHWLQRQAERVDAVRVETVRLSTELAASCNSAFEEGFAYVITRDEDERGLFLDRFAALKAKQKVVLGRPDIRPDEATALHAFAANTEVALGVATAMFDAMRFRTGPVDAAAIAAYEEAMDALVESAERLEKVVLSRAETDDALQRVQSDRALFGIGAVALVFALALGSFFGRRLTGPLIRLRDATAAFGRGDTDRIEVDAPHDEIGDLATTCADMAASVGRLVATLGERNAATRLVLDNVDQGLFTIDRTGAISPEHSAILGSWFGDPTPGEPIQAFFGRVAGPFASRTQQAWEEVVAGIMPLALTLEQMPAELTAAGRHYRVSYSPIGDSDVPERFLVVVSDVTREVAAELAQREMKETLAIFEHALADRGGFVGFMDEASALIATLLVPDLPSARQRRLLHTLKGNAASFGLQTIAATCHDLESRAIESSSAMTPRELGPLAERWSRISSTVDRLLGAKRRTIELSDEQHATLERAVQRHASYGDLARMVQELKLAPTRRRMNHFAEQARALATVLEKAELAVVVADNGLRVDDRYWARFWSEMVHAVRNAVDHGIEPADERTARGKAARGRVDLTTRLEGANFVVEIEDDGRGIDWEAIRARSAARGVPCATPEELAAALFSDGVSTATTVTDLSGRGLGMGALLAATEDLGGSLQVDSELGRGTRVRMVFPSEKMAPELEKPVRSAPPPSVASGPRVGSALQ